MSETDPSPLLALQRRLNYAFREVALLECALTHPSYLQDHPSAGQNNQRLEFLGDAVLQLILTRRLFDLFPDEREGGLSKRRSALTRGAFLVQLSLESGLDACLRLGASEEMAGGRTRASALEDGFEALIGALYLDGGFDAAQRVVLSVYGDLSARLAAVGDTENPKGRLQERVQPIHGNRALRYDVVSAEGADHAKAFEVAVYLNDQPIGRGRGPSKKMAEDAAAREALENLAEMG